MHLRKMTNSPCEAGYLLQEVPRDVGGLFPKGGAAKKDWSAAVGQDVTHNKSCLHNA